MDDQLLVTNIQRYSLNDGPGIRTTVFLKGCNLHCAWCHNPECISREAEIYWKQALCQQCGLCFDVCPKEAIQPPIAIGKDEENEHYYKIEVARCDRCMKCVEACHYAALAGVGEQRTVEEVLDEVERDAMFYFNSGGGMTITGGEPALFPEITLSLLRGGKERGLHNCLDTSGFCSWEVLESMRNYVDIFLYDLKNLDGEAHRRETGVGNELILSNLERLAGVGSAIHIRIPVIAGFNDSLEHMDRVAGLLESLAPAVSQVDLLPFHNWCQDKYRWLGLKWGLKDSESLNNFEVEDLKDILEDRGIMTTIGG